MGCFLSLRLFSRLTICGPLFNFKIQKIWELTSFSSLTPGQKAYVIKMSLQEKNIQKESCASSCRRKSSFLFKTIGTSAMFAQFEASTCTVLSSIRKLLSRPQEISNFNHLPDGWDSTELSQKRTCWVSLKSLKLWRKLFESTPSPSFGKSDNFCRRGLLIRDKSQKFAQ